MTGALRLVSLNANEVLSDPGAVEEVRVTAPPAEEHHGGDDGPPPCSFSVVLDGAGYHVIETEGMDPAAWIVVVRGNLAGDEAAHLAAALNRRNGYQTRYWE
jgi:hypothetical protein